MKTKITNKIFAFIIIALLIIISSNNVFATITPKDISGDDIELNLGFVDDVTEFIRTIGSFIAVGVLMIIGIRYMMGSIEERASYKKSMMPYIIGCFILFGAANLIPALKDIAETINGDNVETMGNSILGIIQAIGTYISVGILMTIGIRYMMGSVEERASYKKSMIPYLIGAILLFAAVNITSTIYKLSVNTGSGMSGGGKPAIMVEK